MNLKETESQFDEVQSCTFDQEGNNNIMYQNAEEKL